MTRVSLVGTPDEVRDGLAGFVEATGVDEVIVTCGAHDHEDRLRSSSCSPTRGAEPGPGAAPTPTSDRLRPMTEGMTDRETRDLRRVTLTRDSVGRYTARNDRGGSITLSSGTDELSPVELLLAGIAGCTAVDVDTVTTRRAEPDTSRSR